MNRWWYEHHLIFYFILHHHRGEDEPRWQHSQQDQHIQHDMTQPGGWRGQRYSNASSAVAWAAQWYSGIQHCSEALALFFCFLAKKRHRFWNPRWWSFHHHRIKSNGLQKNWQWWLFGTHSGGCINLVAPMQAYLSYFNNSISKKIMLKHTSGMLS